MGPFARCGHVALMGVIRRLPLPLGRLMFRAYHKALRTLRPTYRAQAYFGATFICDPHDLIQRMILYFGVWEPDISRTIERSLSPGDVFVDIGSNIGYDALLASRQVGPGGHVVAIEASARTFALLQGNLALNNAVNVRAVNAAVAVHAGKLDLYEISDGNIGAATTLATRGGQWRESVDAMSLDEILTPEEIARVRLVKMDVEGAEAPILRGLLDRLAVYPPDMDIIVEASPGEDAAWAAIFDRLIGAGFAAYTIANEYELDWYLAWRAPTPLRRIAALPNRQQDLLFTRRPVGT